MSANLDKYMFDRIKELERRVKALETLIAKPEKPPVVVYESSSGPPNLGPYSW